MTAVGMTLILSTNDLEAVEIAALARARGLGVVDLGLPWGAAPDPADPRLAPDALAPVVVLVELPDPGLEEALRRAGRRAGRRVVVIDHHRTTHPLDGTAIDRRGPLSSLEQVARLLGAEPLTRRQRLVAAADRGFWPDLMAELAGEPDAVETARALRLEDLAIRLGGAEAARDALDRAVAWLDGAGAAGALATLSTRQGPRDGGAVTLIRAPRDLAPVLMDAVYARALRDGATADAVREVVAVFQAADGAPTGMMASLAGTRTGLLDDLMTWAAAQDGPVGRLRLWSGGGGRTAFLGAAPGPDGNGAALDEVVDRLLESLLLGQRAVRRWRTQFLAVVETTDGDARPAADAVFVPAGAEERLYVAPHRRDLLAPSTPDGHACALRSFRVPCAGLALRIGRAEGGPAEGGPPVPEALVPICDLMVHTVGGRLAVVEWACEGGVAEAGDDTAPRWPRLMEEARALAALPPGTVATVAQVLDFNEAARMLYAPFAAPGARRDVALLRDGRELGRLAWAAAVSTEPPRPTGWFAALTGLALGNRPEAVALVHDERARVVASLVPAGAAPALPAGEAAGRVLLARFAGVDAYGTGHAYGSDFAEKELARGAYDRFAEFGTRYVATAHSLVMLGHGWFPAHVTAGHLATLYRRMFLVALLRGAMADRIEAALATATARPPEAARQRLSTLRAATAGFLATLGTGPVTGQMQGMELFALMLRETGADTRLAGALAALERLEAALSAR